MAKGIYVGAEGERAVSGDIIPKTWSVVTEDDEYISDNGIILKVGAGSMDSKPATNACDGSVDTYWQTTATTGAWLRLQFPEKKKITKMKLRATASTSSRVSKIDIRGRNEGGTWIDLYSTTTAQTALTEVTLSNTDYYQYYIVNVTLSSSNYVEIYDWQTSEYVEESTNGVAKKVTKAYVGVSEAEKFVDFTSNPAPTGWTSSSDYLSATASNDYGKWNVEATPTTIYSASRVSYAFDGDNNGTVYGPDDMPSNSAVYLTLIPPTEISIKPTSIYVKQSMCNYTTKPCYVQAFDGEQWDNLGTLNASTEQTFSISTDKYYSKFRLELHAEDGEDALSIYSFRLMSGTIKISEKLNISRKIKKGYIGVNGVARLLYDGRTPITTSQVFFKTWTYTDGSKTITGQATASLQDGTTPTLKISTSATNGYLHSTSTSENYTSLFSTDTSGNKNTSATYLNNVLARTSYSSSAYASFRAYTVAGSNAYLFTNEFQFDFKESRKLTLNMRMYCSDSTATCYFYGRNNESDAWTEIGDIAKSGAVTITPDVAYRYYIVAIKKVSNFRIHYMYFTNVDDWN